MALGEVGRVEQREARHRVRLLDARLLVHPSQELAHRGQAHLLARELQVLLLQGRELLALEQHRASVARQAVDLAIELGDPVAQLVHLGRLVGEVATRRRQLGLEQRHLGLQRPRGVHGFLGLLGQRHRPVLLFEDADAPAGTTRTNA